MTKKARLTSYLFSFPLNRSYLLAIQTLTGSVDIFCGRTKKILEKSRPGAFINPEPLGNNMFRYLKDHHYLLTRREEESLLLKRSQKIIRMKSGLKKIFVSINPTEQCNLACAYCVNALNRARTKKIVMSPEQVRQIFYLLDRMAKEEKITIAEGAIKMLGGEPILPVTKPAILAIAAEAKKRNLKLDITSNGTYLVDYADTLKKYRRVFRHFQITLDGPESVHNARRKTPSGVGYFKEILKGIDLLLSLGIEVTLRSNLDKNTIRFLPEIGKIIKRKNWHKNRLFYFRPHSVEDNCSGRPEACSSLMTRAEFLKKTFLITEKNKTLSDIVGPFSFMAEPEELLLKAAYPEKNKFLRFFPSLSACATVGAKSYTFDADGKIYACNAAAGIKQFCLGSYYPEYKPDKKIIRQWEKRYATNIKACRYCRFLFMCGGGCPLDNYRTTGRINGVDKNWCQHFYPALMAAAEILRKPILARIKEKLSTRVSSGT